MLTTEQQRHEDSLEAAARTILDSYQSAAVEVLAHINTFDTELTDNAKIAIDEYAQSSVYGGADVEAKKQAMIDAFVDVLASILNDEQNPLHGSRYFTANYLDDLASL